ncbi:hypothetical protein DYE50_01665 [Treponema ruminis]|nr:hypothetical protein DYE50_01665 [Treponema ruminis]
MTPILLISSRCLKLTLNLLQSLLQSHFKVNFKVSEVISCYSTTMTFKSIVSPESLHPQPEAFKDAEIAEESPAAVLGKNTLPEFSMIRLTTLQNLTVVILKLFALLYIVSNNFS